MGMYENPRRVSRLTRQTLALVLAGGRGSRLLDLTRWRPEAALFFGGKLRIIDFTLSNCINSGIRRIGVLTQYKAHSLIRHLTKGWSFLRSDIGEFVEALPASQRTSNNWYAGTADAVFQNLDLIRIYKPELVLILASDQVYKMDYGPLLAYHTQHNADLTLSCIEVPIDEARHNYGVVTVNEEGRVTGFSEKPADPAPLPNNPEQTLASMSIYVFNTGFLYEQLIKDADTRGSTRDFARDIVPGVIKKYRVMAYPFRAAESGRAPYWRDIGTVDAFYKANMELLSVDPELNLYDQDWPILTHQLQLPSAKFVFEDDGRRGCAVSSIVSGGCIISGAEIRHSLLFSGVRINSYASVERSVLLPSVDIGRHCRIRNAVIESGTRIPADTVIGYDPIEDAKRYHVTPDGVVLVTPNPGDEMNIVY